jgi:hypothetical protein
LIEQLDRELQLAEAELAGEQAHQAAQALGRHQHQRAEAAAAGLGAARQRGHAIERDQRLAHAGLAVDHQRLIGGQLDGGSLHRIEHDQLAAVRFVDAHGLRARAWLAGVAGVAAHAHVAGVAAHLLVADGLPWRARLVIRDEETSFLRRATWARLVSTRWGGGDRAAAGRCGCSFAGSSLRSAQLPSRSHLYEQRNDATTR